MTPSNGILVSCCADVSIGFKEIPHHIIPATDMR